MCQNTCTEIVKKAIENEIKIFDTAPWYGGGLSETRLGIVCKLRKYF